MTLQEGIVMPQKERHKGEMADHREVGGGLSLVSCRMKQPEVSCLRHSFRRVQSKRRGAHEQHVSGAKCA